MLLKNLKRSFEMMKKKIVLLLVVVMTFSLFAFGCAQKNEEPANEEKQAEEPGKENTE